MGVTNFFEGLHFTAAFATSLYRKATVNELVTIYKDLVALCTQDVRFDHLKHGDQVVQSLREVELSNRTTDHSLQQPIETSLGITILDPEQSILMMQMYGEVFVSALDILAHNANIVVRTWDTRNIENYFSMWFEPGRRVAIAIRKQLVSCYHRQEENLAYSAILANVGLRVATNESITFAPLSTTPVYLKEWHPNQYYAVDLRTWYCSCAVYMSQQRYGSTNNNSQPNDMVSSIENQTIQRLVRSITTLRPSYPEIQESLPMCSHLLALLIIALNPLKRQPYCIYNESTRATS